jgi:uncharacterized protein YjiS (DUF1127 family)
LYSPQDDCDAFESGRTPEIGARVSVPRVNGVATPTSHLDLDLPRNPSKPMQNEKAFIAAPTRRAQARRSASGQSTTAWNRLQSSLKAWWRDRAAILELASLSDWELRDIGLNRSEISYLVKSGWTTAALSPEADRRCDAKRRKGQALHAEHESPALATAKDMRV